MLSLSYFKSEGLLNSLEEIPLEYFEKAFDWLSTQAGLVPNEYAILGVRKDLKLHFCWAVDIPR